MEKQEISDDELVEELDKAFKATDAKKDVFKITRDEKIALDQKENRIKKKFKS